MQLHIFRGSLISSVYNDKLEYKSDQVNKITDGPSRLPNTAKDEISHEKVE